MQFHRNQLPVHQRSQAFHYTSGLVMIKTRFEDIYALNRLSIVSLMI